MSSPLQVGILGASSFALRTMAPALARCSGLRLRAIASRDKSKAESAASAAGCEAVVGYEALVDRPDIDVVYVPLPPALHEDWVLLALRRGKHVLCEKPFAPDPAGAERMIAVARAAGKLVAENILFPHHSLVWEVKRRIDAGEIGALRLLRCAFTIPPLKPDDVRHQPALGGGARYDVGTYPARLARIFLGDDFEVEAASETICPQRRVDVRGFAQLRGANGAVGQAVWGFDMQYQCSWEFHGAKGRLTVDRAFTPPPDFPPALRIERGIERVEEKLKPDDQAANVLTAFARTAVSGAFEEAYAELVRQSRALARLAGKTVKEIRP